MKRLLLAFILLFPAVAHAQTTVQGAVNGYPVAVQGIAGGIAVPISGTVTTTLCTSSTCTETVVQPTAANLNATVNMSQINGITPTQATGGGLAVTTVIGTAVTEYTGTGATVFTASATASTVVTANTLIIEAMRCNNTTAGAITLNWTDTAGNSFDTSFSIPANSNYYAVSPGSKFKVVGLKLWASAINSLNCIITAKQ